MKNQIEQETSFAESILFLINESDLVIKANEDGSFMHFFEIETAPFYIDFYAHGTAKITHYSATHDQPADCEITPVDINITGIKIYDSEGITVRITPDQEKELSERLSRLIEIK